MPIGFIEFSILFIALNTLLDILHMKFFRDIHGIDFIFFAPWLAGVLFGFYQGIIFSIVLLAIHAVLKLKLVFYEFASFPAVVLAVLIGGIWNVGGFWAALVLFLVASSVTVAVLRGFGGRFVSFLFISFIFNALLFLSIPLFVG